MFLDLIFFQSSPASDVLVLVDEMDVMDGFGNNDDFG